MRIIDRPISLTELRQMATNRFGNLVKAVVDTEKEAMALDAELHADEEAALLAAGGKQKDLWGINLYPELWGTDDFIEFDSMINVRPSMGNITRGVDDPKIKNKIMTVVTDLIKS